MKRNGVELWLVPALMTPLVLPKVRDFLKRGYQDSGGIYDEIVILRELALDRMGLWVAVRARFWFDAAMTTRIYQTHDAKVLHIIALGGKRLPEWINLMPQIEAYARKMSCDRIRVEGREGWSRMLPSFVQVGVILEKRMTEHGLGSDPDAEPEPDPEYHASR